MIKKKHPEYKTSNETNETPERRSKARRRLLHSLAMGGAAVTVKSLPERWTQPILNDAILPAHAEASPGPECDLECEIVEVIGIGNDFSGVPATGGGTINVDSITGADAFSFQQITATVDPGCPGDVDLQVNLALNSGDETVVLLGGSQDESVIGGVATFDPVTVSIDLPAQAGSGLAGTLQFVFSTAGAEPDCVIDVNFSET